MTAPTHSFLFGANYPWSLEGTTSMYGRDFGADRQGVHAGISMRPGTIQADFAAMRDAGVSALRWFLFCDGRTGVRFTDSMPHPDAYLFADIDVMLASAERFNITLIPVLLDYLWMLHGYVPASARLSQALIDGLFVPLFRHCGDHSNILAWDIMNEPDWVVKELDVPREKKRAAVPLSTFRQFVHDVSNAVHELTPHQVTLGGGRVKYLRTWDDDFLGLDLLQVHAYNDFLRTPYDEPLYGRACSELQLRRPLLVGEFPANLDGHLPSKKERLRTIPLSDYVSFLRREGYAGALYWSFNGVDEFGSLSLASITSLA